MKVWGASRQSPVDRHVGRLVREWQVPLAQHRRDVDLRGDGLRVERLDGRQTVGDFGVAARGQLADREGLPVEVLQRGQPQVFGLRGVHGEQPYHLIAVQLLGQRHDRLDDRGRRRATAAVAGEAGVTGDDEREQHPR